MIDSHSMRAGQPAQTADTAGPGFRGLALRGGATAMAAQTVKLALTFISTMILARLLTPSDFGVVAMVASITGALHVLLDGGLSAATIQHQDLTDARVSALFWVNAGMGLALGAICVGLAPVIVWLYDDPRLYDVTLISALGLLLSGLGVQHAALLARDLRVRAIAAIDVVAMLTGVVVAIVLTGLGSGYLSIAWMPVAQAAARLIGLLLVLRWMPALSLASGTVLKDLSFGARVTGTGLMDYFSRSLDNVFIGRVWGESALGLYYRAYSLLMLPIRQILSPVSAVAFPTLARLQSDPARFRRYYLEALFLLTAITTPLCLALAVLAAEVVYVVLGPQWGEVAPIFRILCVASALQPITGTGWWLYSATGRGHAMLRWGSVGSTLFIVSFLIGLPYGPAGVATAYATANVLWFLPCMKFAVAGTDVTTTDILRVVRIPLLASLPALAWIVAVRSLLGDALPLVAWLLAAATGMVAIYGSLLAFVFGKKDLFLAIVAHLVASKR